MKPRMAFDIFSIPAIMSSEVERVFSSAKKLTTDERNCLGSDVVEACETQKALAKGRSCKLGEFSSILAVQFTLCNYAIVRPHVAEVLFS
jgi:hAT family C-terminal dimerisation region